MTALDLNVFNFEENTTAHARVARGAGAGVGSVVSRWLKTAIQRSATPQRRVGDRIREAIAIAAAGDVYQDLGRFEEAVDFYTVAAATQHDMRSRWHHACTLASWSDASQRLGDTDSALAHRTEALALVGTLPRPCRDGSAGPAAGSSPGRLIRLRRGLDNPDRGAGALHAQPVGLSQRRANHAPPYTVNHSDRRPPQIREHPYLVVDLRGGAARLARAISPA